MGQTRVPLHLAEWLKLWSEAGDKLVDMIDLRCGE